MYYIICILLSMIIGVLGFLFAYNQQSSIVIHDSKLVNHHNDMMQEIAHMYADLESFKKIASNNSKKLDNLLNIATNSINNTDN